jgi:hypothetical protein
MHLVRWRDLDPEHWWYEEHHTTAKFGESQLWVELPFNTLPEAVDWLIEEIQDVGSPVIYWSDPPPP